MFCFSPYYSSPQCCYYLYMPPTPSFHQDSISQDQKLPKDESPKIGIISPSEEDKIILTRQDLQVEGYEQTKRPWTPAQDKLLLSLCKNQNARFEQIAACIEGRNAKMCYSRYRRLSYLTKVVWSKSDNQRLMRMVEEHGENWKHISDLFKDKTSKQLKEHYTNYLKPELIKSEWTLEQDIKLIQLINKYGKNWKSIQEELVGRSRSQIKNRYFGKLSRLNNKKIQEMNKIPQP